MTDTLFDLNDVESSAVISDDGVYRYSLERSWADGPRMLFVMLNPSTADGERDDQTIGRCIGFARREGCGSLEVVNLFAYRATDPDELLHCPVNAIGSENFTYQRDAARRAQTVVAAWGTHGCATQLAITIARAAICRPMWCLGVTRSGMPRHPSRLNSLQPLLPWTPPW